MFVKDKKKEGNKMEKRFVYADNSATTRVCDEAVSAMLPFFTEEYGNPSSIYPFASESKKALEALKDAAIYVCDQNIILYMIGSNSIVLFFINIFLSN